MSDRDQPLMNEFNYFHSLTPYTS